MAAAGAQPVTLQNATATCTQDILGTYPPDAAIDGSIDSGTGWSIYCDGLKAVSETAVFETQSDVTVDQLTFVLHQIYSGPGHTLGKFRLSATAAARDQFADGADNGGALGDPSIWIVLDPSSAVSTGGATLTEQGDHSILASGTSPSTAVYTVVAPTPLSGITGIRLEVLEDASLPFMGPGRETQTGNFVLSEITVDACTVNLMDLDDDDAIGPLTDALLVLRYAFGFRGATLIGGAVDPDCERCLAPEIEAFLACMFLAPT